MKTDIELRSDGMKLLRRQLGLVESERFLTLMLREPFDYTKWRQHQWSDSTVTDLAEKSRQLRACIEPLAPSPPLPIPNAFT